MTDILDRLEGINTREAAVQWAAEASIEIKRQREALEQIAIVCTDNMDRDKNHRMALDFVRQIANDTLESHD